MSDRSFRMTVQGMTCPSCERHVIRALTGAGASEVTASYRRREAWFRYDAHADRKPLIEAVRGAGYRPGAVEEVRVDSAVNGTGDTSLAVSDGPAGPAGSRERRSDGMNRNDVAAAIGAAVLMGVCCGGPLLVLAGAAIVSWIGAPAVAVIVGGLAVAAGIVLWRRRRCADCAVPSTKRGTELSRSRQGR